MGMHAMDKQRCNMIISKLFESMDTSKSGSITLYEFEKQFHDENVKASLSLLGSTPSTHGHSSGFWTPKAPETWMQRRLQQIEARSRQLVEHVAEVKSLCSRMSDQC